MSPTRSEFSELDIAQPLNTPTTTTTNGIKMKSTNTQNNRSRQDQVQKIMKDNMLPLCTFSAVLGAIILGIFIRAASGKWTERELMYLEFPGEMFLRCLKCLTIPLIISSLVSALGNLDLRLSGQIGKRALIYYLSTTAIAISLGIFLVLTLHPGSGESEKAKGNAPKLARKITTPDTLLDLIR